MLKAFIITIALVSSVNAAAEFSLDDNFTSVNLVVQHLDNQFPRPHVVSLSDVSAAIQAIYPNIDRAQSLQLQVDVGILYLTR